MYVHTAVFVILCVFLGLLACTCIFLAVASVGYLHAAVNPEFVLCVSEDMDDLVSGANEVARMLDEAGVKYVTNAGTQLGMGRFSSPIHWDDDVDLSVMETDIAKVDAALDADPRFKVNRDEWCHGITVEGLKGHVDIFFLVENKVDNTIRFRYKPPSGVFAENWVRDYLTPEEWDSVQPAPFGAHMGNDATKTTLNTLPEPDAYLSRLYGPDWRTHGVAFPMHSGPGIKSKWERFMIFTRYYSKFV